MYNAMIAYCVCLIPPVNCSLTVIDCRNFQVQYKIEHIDSSCSGPRVSVTQTHTSTVGRMDNEGSGSLVLSQTVQFIVISLVVCIFCSLCFFTVGVLCRRHCSKPSKPQPATGLQSPQCEDILHKHSRSEQIELKENEAYGPLQY